MYQGKKRGLAPSESSESSQSAPGEEDDDHEDTNSFTLFAGARPDTSDDGSSPHDESFQTTEDDSFIVDDDGAPPAELPVEYSMSTHQDLAHHFKIICQFFVYVAVRPVAERRSFMEDAMKSELLSLSSVNHDLTGLPCARRRILLRTFDDRSPQTLRHTRLSRFFCLATRL